MISFSILVLVVFGHDEVLHQLKISSPRWFHQGNVSEVLTDHDLRGRSTIFERPRFDE